ncbi:hypothetical protein [Cupriavidus basilensis]|uniref:hypothetical protein n=1 Tax=Cupriavidus basilensis TaxID=68895 RepID=UPI00075181D5|nr:hypothetical protein [Cupriavidus basilensis]
MTEKLQITVTLSADACPDLIKYLRQFTSARERTFVFRLLAQRGLEVMAGASPVTLLPTARLISQSARPEPSPAGERDAFQVSAPPPAQAVPAHDLAGSQQAPPLAPSGVDEAAADLSPALSIDALDLGALNDAMARFV